MSLKNTAKNIPLISVNLYWFKMISKNIYQVRLLLKHNNTGGLFNRIVAMLRTISVLIIKFRRFLTIERIYFK